MRISRYLLAGMMLAGLSTQAQALDMNKASHYGYNFIEGGYVMHDGFGGEGFHLGASIDFNQTMGIILNYETVSNEEDFFGTTLESQLDVLQIGTGYHHKYDYSAVTPGSFLANMDMWYKIGLERSTMTFSWEPFFPEAEASKTGLFASIQARKEVVSSLEISLEYMFHSAYMVSPPIVDPITGQTVGGETTRAYELGLQANYTFTGGLAGYLNYRVLDDGIIPLMGDFTSTTLGIRYTF